MIGRGMFNRLNEPAWRALLRRAVAGMLFLTMLNSRYFAVNDVGDPLITFNNNGAWSWFEDERAIVDPNAGTAEQIILSSVGHAGGAGSNGDVEVTSFDLATAALNRFTLADNLEADEASELLGITPTQPSTNKRHADGQPAHPDDPTPEKPKTTNS
jgi:hypothetical protein